MLLRGVGVNVQMFRMGPKQWALPKASSLIYVTCSKTLTKEFAWDKFTRQKQKVNKTTFKFLENIFILRKIIKIHDRELYRSNI